ncbi:MAG: glycosyl transferase family 2 [Armatimonadota bacterium]
MSVSCIIPAYNEETRIGAVLGAVCASELVNEIIVVNDGSRDRTSDVARAFPKVTVVDLAFNVGKGGAIAAGLESVIGEILLLLDADLVGLEVRHVDALLMPVLAGVDMTLGLFKKGKLWSDAAQAITPAISGQRALRRRILDAVPNLIACRMGVEIAIHQAAKDLGCSIKKVDLDGVTHTPKEVKFGLVRGATARAKMYAEIGRTIVRSRKKNGNGGSGA